MRAAGTVFYTLGRDEPTETHGSEGQLNNTLSSIWLRSHCSSQTWPINQRERKERTARPQPTPQTIVLQIYFVCLCVFYASEWCIKL